MPGGQEIGSSSSLLGSYEIGGSEIGSLQLGSHEIGSRQLGSRLLGSHEIGSRQLGSRLFADRSFDLGKPPPIAGI